MSLNPSSLAQAIEKAKTASGLSEYALWQTVEGGLHSYWRMGRPAGIGKDEVLGLKRAAAAEGGWYVGGDFVPMADWLRRFAEWQR
jgi:hypothetical protein